MLIFTGSAPAAAVIPEGGTPTSNGLTDDLFHGSNQARALMLGKSTPGQTRIYPGPEQGLIHINITQSCHDALVQKQGLYRRLALGQNVAQPLGIKVRAQGLGTQVRKTP